MKPTLALFCPRCSTDPHTHANGSRICGNTGCPCDLKLPPKPLRKQKAAA